MQADEDSYVLHGTVDLLFSPDGTNREPASLEIWDYKGMLRPRDNDHRLSDFRLQMMVYADLYRRRHGVFPARAHLYFLNELIANDASSIENRRARAALTVELTTQEVRAALEEFRDTVKRIEECRALDQWPAPEVGQGPGKATCKICDFRWSCPTVREDRELQREIPIRYP
jgi:putative RecB family exonuclease